MKYETKPTEGNINLMISINEIHDSLKPMKELNESSHTIGLKKIGKFSYEKTSILDGEDVAILHEADLFGVLNATRGLYNCRDKSDSITDETRFRIELKKENNCWTQDTGESQ